MRGSRRVGEGGRWGWARLPEGPSEEGPTSKASKSKELTSFHLILPSIHRIKSSTEGSARKIEKYLLSTTRMPGKGGLGGATSSSVASGSSSVDCDRPVVLFRISISLSVRGSSDWLRMAENSGYKDYRDTGPKRVRK